jgi:Na+/H+ antiporter NhaD/arsenite permease-like protein
MSLLDGASLGAGWALPFLGVVLSIALCPLLAPAFWQRHLGKVAAAWALAFLLPFGVLHGGGITAFELARTALDDYLPFLIMLGTLFTIAGGILVTGHIHGSPGANVVLLLTGTLLASLIGNIGASMVMIRPLIRANQGRRHNAHVVIFFIFLVANIGGCLTPLGNLPLFLGYLRGVSFFWPLTHVLAETGFAVFVLLGAFWLIDCHLARQDVDRLGRIDPTPGGGRFGIEGKVNLALLFLVAGAVLLSGFWQPGIALPVGGGLTVAVQNLVRDALLVVCAALSLGLTPRRVRDSNAFAWAPLIEVGKLFAAIFVTIIPVIAMLRAAREGAFAPLLALVSTAGGTPVNAMYFWAAGLLSSFLDNAPTYLVFFNLAGGDAHRLMGPLGGTLAAIASGATFMGANSYIGNAPNFMVKAIAEDAGFRMPSFFGYMGWSGAILLPLFAVITVVFF